MNKGKRKEEQEQIREAGLDLVRGERRVYNHSHLVVRTQKQFCIKSHCETDMMDHYRVCYGGYREHSTRYLTVFPPLSLFTLIQIHNQTHASMRCAKDMHICMHPPPCNFSVDNYTSTEAFFSPSDIDHPPTHIYAAKRHRDEAYIQGNLPPLHFFSVSLNPHVL